jgi:putative transcriptional regulator
MKLIYRSKLREYRVMMGLSQEKLAQKCECSRVTIRNIENGSAPNIILAIRLSEVLGINIYNLFIEEEVAS